MVILRVSVVERHRAVSEENRAVDAYNYTQVHTKNHVPEGYRATLSDEHDQRQADACTGAWPSRVW